MLRHSIIFIFIFISGFSTSQEVIVFGADNYQNIKVTASSSTNEAAPINIINGTGKDAKLMEAARFLSQASFGYKMPEVEALIDSDFEGWIDSQFSKPLHLYSDELQRIWSQVFQMRKNSGVPEDEIYGPATLHFNYSWWQNVVTRDDQLRHRIAFALSQILVVSSNSDLAHYGESMASYYDILYKNAFENYLDILMEVSYHPAMGYYLSHLNNPKTTSSGTLRPDENFARELMQLFTIGLHELSQNGTTRITQDGRPLPTYNANDIRELAQVFTGLGAGAVNDKYPQIAEPFFGLGFWGVDRETPMVMYDEYHDVSEKKLINGLTLPADQNGDQDIKDAIENLFNHPNVGPFIARQLIQSLVKSNPTPGYIYRVASAFNDNGSGTRGDLKAVIKTILLDEEARSCLAIQGPDQGKLKEPLLRYAQLARTLDLVSPFGRYWDNGYGHLEWTGQMALSAPSVFNFFEPDFQPNDQFIQEDLFGPEYKILNSKTSIGYINQINTGVIWDYFMSSRELDYGDEVIKVDLTSLEPFATDLERIVNHYDILLTNGQLTDRTRKIITDAAGALLHGDVNYDKVRLVLYGLMISPDYLVFK